MIGFIEVFDEDVMRDDDEAAVAAVACGVDVDEMNWILTALMLLLIPISLPFLFIFVLLR